MIDKEFTTGYGDRFEVIHDGGNLFVNAVSCEGNSCCLAYHKCTNEIDQLIDELSEHLEKIVALSANAADSGDDPNADNYWADAEDADCDDEADDDEADEDARPFRHESDARVLAELQMNCECIHFATTPFRLDAEDTTILIEMLTEARGGLMGDPDVNLMHSPRPLKMEGAQ